MSNTAQKKVAITGATGFVGSHLQEMLRAKGWQVVMLGRPDFRLEPAGLAQKMDGAAAVINLAGAPVIARWSDAHKVEMRESRIALTRKLVRAMEKMAQPPEVFISTSALGYYGSTGIHSEEQAVKGEGFLAQLAQEWEEEALKAEGLNIRTVIFRFAVILGKNGGALKKMLLPFKMGLGGIIGSGKQAFSWVHIHDLLQAQLAALESETYQGVYNLTAPKPTNNYDFTKTLGKVLRRPTLFPVPTFILKIIFGEGASILADGQAAVPKRLLDSGFVFAFPDLEGALRDCTGRGK
ncbi:MAG: TIGR01777 family oxidoreductase [Thermodesulfobacteriota bacterium]